MEDDCAVRHGRLKRLGIENISPPKTYIQALEGPQIAACANERLHFVALR